VKDWQKKLLKACKNKRRFSTNPPFLKKISHWLQNYGMFLF